VTKRILCISAFALALGAQLAYAGPVAKVNGADITDAELAFAEAEVGAEIAGLPPESRRRVLVEYLIEAHLFADEAIRASSLPARNSRTASLITSCAPCATPSTRKRSAAG